jgi:hypothetical protein
MSSKPEKAPETPQEPVASAPAKSISVPLEQWTKILETIETQKGQIATLYGAADRARLNAVEGKSAKPLERYVMLRTYVVDGVKKVVAAWRMVKDEVFKGANGAWVENQIVELIFEDDTRIQVSLVDFSRKTQEKLRARIVKRATDEDGRETLTLLGDDGKERVLDVAFVN